MTMHECSMYPDDQALDLLYDAIEEKRQPSWPEMKFHLQAQDTSLPGWVAIQELIEAAVNDQRKVLAPKKDLGPELWSQVLTLPPSIKNLKDVEKLDLYGSSLVRIPPEIGAMENLRQFVPYTSYGLHWFPYEITRCHHLRSSTVSTRSLYGNYKLRQPFPVLTPVIAELAAARCSVCDQKIDSSNFEQVWISLGVATDVLPLLVNACSSACVNVLPESPEGYVLGPHKGGTQVLQPLPD